MSAPSSRQLARERRLRSVADAWRLFLKDRAGVVGLVVLVVFILVAVLAPWIAPAAGLDVTTVKDVSPQAHNGCRPKKRRRV